MSNAPAHTPVPWTVVAETAQGFLVCGGFGLGVASFYCKGDADFCARSTSAYADLLETMVKISRFRGAPGSPSAVMAQLARDALARIPK